MNTNQTLIKTGSLIWRYRLVCLLGVLLVTGVVLAAAKDVRFIGPSSQAYLAANPELALARRYAASPPQVSRHAYLADNPELTLARRYAALKILSEAAHLADNPELSLARRFAKDMEKSNESAYLAANPEVALARRIMSTQSPK